MGDHYTRGRNRALAVWEIESGGLEIGGFTLPSDPGNQPQGQGNPRGGRSGWNPVHNPPRKRTPNESGGYSEGYPRKGRISRSSQGPRAPHPPRPPPPREDKRRKAKSISYNIGNSTQIHRATITANEKEERNAQTTKAIRLKGRAT